MTELKDVKFMTAQDKARVLRQWEGFLKGGLKWEQFHRALYEHLILHCSFIAHYNRQGFYSTYFENGEDTAHFLTQFDNRNGTPNSIEYGMAYWYRDGDYEDVNSEMCRIAVRYIDGLTGQARKKQEEADIAEARRLLNKHGISLNA